MSCSSGSLQPPLPPSAWYPPRHLLIPPLLYSPSLPPLFFLPSASGQPARHPYIASPHLPWTRLPPASNVCPHYAHPRWAYLSYVHFFGMPIFPRTCLPPSQSPALSTPPPAQPHVPALLNAHPRVLSPCFCSVSPARSTAFFPSPCCLLPGLLSDFDRLLLRMLLTRPPRDALTDPTPSVSSIYPLPAFSPAFSSTLYRPSHIGSSVPFFQTIIYKLI